MPNFPNFPKYKKLDIILRGIHIENPDLLLLNTILTIAVQNFTLQTKRLSDFDFFCSIQFQKIGGGLQVLEHDKLYQ
jgi:hypothetical protein